jgi:hypothetical protein
MKKIVVLSACLIWIKTSFAQKLTGLWFSSDSTRVYEIKESTANKYTAVIKSSARKTDQAGYVVIDDLTYNNRKKRFEGFMFAVEDGSAVFVKIKFSRNDINVLNLKLSRAFIFDVSINWKKSIGELPMPAL